ncbi:MAG TPA: hypothetical protein VIX15_00620, partial [Streptosporangiaceae bacterium]
NVVGLVIAELVIALTTYGLGYKSALAYNAASVLGTGLGTIFRYFAYKKWVFLAAPSTVTAPVLARAESDSYGPPWEVLTEADYDAPRR